MDLLDSTREEAEANQERVFRAVRRALVEYAGLAEDERDMGEIIRALYRYVAATPAQLVVLTLADAVQEQLTENQPGTKFEYPNWCVPLRDQEGNTRFLEDVTADQFANQLLEMLEKAVHPG
ncbi:4-alpha-glucanotransferase [Varibaculum cambriense]|nr:4-alpha-glucanotransferase [Varibaculum cambriense]